MSEKEYLQKLQDKTIRYRTSLNLPKNLTFGVEIEYENVENELISVLLYEEQRFDKDLLNWINKKELDIQEHNKLGEKMNGEINSPILKDDIKSWKSLRYILNLLNRNNAIITDHCGGHINIGIKVFEENIKYFKNFLLLWILYENEIYQFSSGEFFKVRDYSQNYARKLKDDLSIESILNIKKLSENYSMPYSLFDKIHAFSLCEFPYPTFNKGGRIEFRIPNGTLKEEIWQNYINFFAKFIIVSKKELDIEKILYKIKNDQHNIVELANLVFDNNIDKEYFLIQALKTNKIYNKKIPSHIFHY